MRDGGSSSPRTQINERIGNMEKYVIKCTLHIKDRTNELLKLNLLSG